MGVERKIITYRYQMDNTARELEYDFELPASSPGSEMEVRKIRSGAKQRRRKRRRQQARLRAFVTALIIIIAFGGLAVKAAHVHLIKGTQVKLMDQEIKTLSLEKDGLKKKVDLLSSIQHIEKTALAMGMERPEGTIYVDKNLLQAKTQGDTQSQFVQNSAENPTSISVSGQGAQTLVAAKTEIMETEKEKGFLLKLFERLITVIS